jgi:hypothetical protein
MKKLITLALILCATTFIQAQNNLEFSRVLLIDLLDGPQTVPAGTVWKIVAIDGTTTAERLNVNDRTWYWDVGDDIWFPEGTTLSKRLTEAFRFSVIEFSTVPIENSGGTAVVPEHADNAAALSAGLTIGNFYRTGDFLKVVH